MSKATMAIGGPVNKPDKIGGCDRWEVQDALRTLNNAEKIRKDKKMMAAVRLLAKEQMAALQQHVKGGEK